MNKLPELETAKALMTEGENVVGDEVAARKETSAQDCRLGECSAGSTQRNH